MPSNFLSMHAKQMGFAMSPSYSHTLNASLPDDDDDGDICPVCDGECTCNAVLRPLTPPPPVPSGPLTMEELSRQYTAPTSHSAKQPKKSYPSLKIKLAIPSTMLAKRQIAAPEASGSGSGSSSSSTHRKMYVDGSVEENYACIAEGTATPTPSSYNRSAPHPPRKRGRPRKIHPVARDHSVDSESISPIAAKRSNPKTNIIGRQKYAQKFAKTLKAAAPKKKKVPPPKRRRRIDSESSQSELSDDDDFGMLSRSYEPESSRFPTFVSASALSSMESGGDGNSTDSSSSLSGFDSDLSLEQEEEAFLRSEHSEWVIRGRRKSAGLSDAEMDSDATEDEDDGEEEEAAQADVEGDDGDQTDVAPIGPPESQDQDYSMKGLVTGWSDEESDFDADVFFANLSSDSDQSSDEEAKESGGRLGEDDDDDTSSDDSTEAELMHMREELENLPLELAESWDGQLMFTNGTLGGQAIIDIDFEVNASQFVTDDGFCKSSQCGGSPHHDHYMSHEGEDSDVEMSAVDDGGYEEDAGEGEGDTTDEELVGEDDLPNERAMRLFNFPLSVSAINPLSTMSPAVTPASKRPGPRMFSASNRLESPSPADILAGKMGWDSADEMDELFDSEQRGRRRDGFKSEGDSIRFLGPRKGVFTPVQETRQVVIDDSRKEVPSPHPRFTRRRGRRFNTVEALLRKHLAALATDPNFAPAPSNAPDIISSSPLKLLPSVEIGNDHAVSSPSGLLDGANPHHHQDQQSEMAAAPIDLDDVFESSFFNPDPSEASGGSGSNSNAHHSGDVGGSGGGAGGAGGSGGDVPPDSATTADESDSNRARNEEMKHLHRWDVINVGAFRQTRESAGTVVLDGSPTTTQRWGSGDHHRHHHHHHHRTPASSTDYGNVLKASPLSTMLWPSSEKAKAAASKKEGRSRRGTMVGGAPTSGLAGSPMVLPNPALGDGDRTPTKRSGGGGGGQTPQQQLLQHHLQLAQQQEDNINDNNNQQQQQKEWYAPKTRKESRKERKSNKKKGFGHSPHGGHHHPAHHYHSHHHHPNTKSRGGSQRTNFFLSSMPPLNI